MNAYDKWLRILTITTAIATLIVGFSDAASAQGRGQRGGGGFGRGFGGPPELSELARESVQTELQLTDEQIASVEEFSGTLAEGTRKILELTFRIPQAESEEDRLALEAELATLRESRDAEVRSELEQILDEGQLQRLNQLVLHRAGPSALAIEDVAEQVGLDENQQIAIADMVEQRRDAIRGGGFRMTREERAEVEREWDTNILDTLEGEQLVAWTDMLGPPPPEEEDPQFMFPVGPDRGDSVADGQPTEGGDDVVSSFESTDGDAETMSFNFRYAPWEDVLREFAERADLQLDLIDLPPGTFSYFKEGAFTPRETRDVLNGYLLQRGYVLVLRDDFLVSIRVDGPGIPPNLIPYVSTSELYERGRNDLMRMVFSVQVEEITELAEQVQEMLGPQGKAIGIDAAQAISVTDIGTNLRSVHEMLEALAALKPDDALTFTAYTIENIPASEAEDTLRALLGMEFEVENVSAAAGGDRGSRGGDPREWWRGGGGGGDNDRNRDNDEDATATGALMANTQITVNARTNQLLVAATQAAHIIIADALEHIDVEGDSRFAMTDTEPYLHVYTLENSSAQEVAKTLGALMPHVVVNEDGDYGTIHIMATAEEHRTVAEWVLKLDGMGATSIAVIPLSSMDALTAASTLNLMFSADGLDAPIVEPNLSGRQIMVRGTADQVAQIRALLAGLGEDGTGTRSGQDRGRIRSLPLSGRNAERLLQLIQAPFESTQPNRFQMIPPQERTPIYDLRLPSGWRESESTDEPVTNETPADTETPVETEVPVGDETPIDDPATPQPQNIETTDVVAESELTDLAQTRLVAFVDDDDASVPAQSDEPEATGDDTQSDETQPADTGVEPEEADSDPVDAEDAGSDEDGEAPRIYIRINGDDIDYFSDDEEALEVFEYMLEDAMAYVQPEINWKIYPLQTADAVETASMLEMLISGTTVSQKSSSTTDLLGTLGSFGSSVLDATGMSASLTSTATLQIIPEPNLNSLFVMGPASKIEELEQFLEILDTSEWPQSYRDRIPRMIPVEHAEISRVYQIVQDVFKDYLEAGEQNAGGGGGGRGGNPFAALMGGGGAAESKPSDTLLTLGVDEQTSHIIVSADEALYQQIKGLVESVDSAAREANRTVRVVSLQNTNSTVLQNTLSSLMPRVQVSTSGSRPSTSQSSQPAAGGGNNQGGGGQPNQDQIRQFFEQRMRERLQQQQGGGQQNGGGRPGGGDDRGGRPGGGDDRGGRPGGGFSFGRSR